MQVLVVSDSHGNVDNMVRAVEWVQPDYVLHLGDCQRDLEALRREFPGLAMEGVPGNCDWGSYDQKERLIELGGVRILMMHGHTRNVKSSPMAAMYAAKGVRRAGAAARAHPQADGGQRRDADDAGTPARRGTGSIPPAAY